MKIIEEKEGWYRIKNMTDSYEGWCTAKMIQTLPECVYENLNKRVPSLTVPVFSKCRMLHANASMYLPAGSRIYTADVNEDVFRIYRDKLNSQSVDSELWRFEKQTDESIFSTSDKSFSISNPEDIAVKFLNAPYLWGGKSILGMDCSGLVQVVYSFLGIFLPRDARDQAKEGIDIFGIDDTKPGDLAFFENTSGNIVHVGIIYGKNRIIHASGSVHIDRLDDIGIYSETLQRYTHKLSLLKRILR